MTRSPSRLPLLAAAAVAAVGLTACSGSTDGSDYRPPRLPVDNVAATPDVGTILSANSTAKLGTVVVDGQGYTLYRFDEDSAKPSTSNCSGECAQKWPPVLATPGTPLTVEGVAQEAVGTINRPDGSVQLTLGGWPVYRYSGDTQPGATSGQGVGGTWAAVKPDGAKAATAAP
jgi:predicted lipoprotein with Yx(FWY)xxD motif